MEHRLFSIEEVNELLPRLEPKPEPASVTSVPTVVRLGVMLLIVGPRFSTRTSSIQMPVAPLVLLPL